MHSTIIIVLIETLFLYFIQICGLIIISGVENGCTIATLKFKLFVLFRGKRISSSDSFSKFSQVCDLP